MASPAELVRGPVGRRFVLTPVEYGLLGSSAVAVGFVGFQLGVGLGIDVTFTAHSISVSGLLGATVFVFLASWAVAALFRSAR